MGQKERIYLLKTCVRYSNKISNKISRTWFYLFYGNKTTNILQVILWFIYVPSKIKADIT